MRGRAYNLYRPGHEHEIRPAVRDRRLPQLYLATPDQGEWACWWQRFSSLASIDVRPAVCILFSTLVYQASHQMSLSTVLVTNPCIPCHTTALP